MLFLLLGFLLDEPALVIFLLLDARALYLRLALRRSAGGGVRVPARLPGGERLFGAITVPQGILLRRVRRIELGAHLQQIGRKRVDLRAVAPDQIDQFLQLNLALVKFGPLPLAQLARVLDALLDAGNLGTGSVIARLHRALRIDAGALFSADPLNRRFNFAKFCERPLQRGIAAAHRLLPSPGVRIESLQSQYEHLGLQLALLFLQHLIAPSGCRLALQMPDLLVHFLAQVIQPIEILARVADAVFRFAATLLVARNARRFLQECPQVIGTRLDDARNHALLDDRITARP